MLAHIAHCFGAGGVHDVECVVAILPIECERPDRSDVIAHVAVADAQHVVAAAGVDRQGAAGLEAVDAKCVVAASGADRDALQVAARAKAGVAQAGDVLRTGAEGIAEGVRDRQRRRRIVHEQRISARAASDAEVSVDREIVLRIARKKGDAVTPAGETDRDLVSHVDVGRRAEDRDGVGAVALRPARSLSCRCS